MKKSLFVLVFLVLIANSVFAMGAPPGDGGSAFMSFLPLLFIIAICYFIFRKRINLGGGRGTEHQKVIRYFTATGCIASLTSIKDNEYDQLVMNKLNGLNLKQRALDKIGLDEDQLKEIPPVFLHGFNFDVTGNVVGVVKSLLPGGQAATSHYIKVGSDGFLKSSKYDAAWLFFSDTQVYMYKYTMDMASDSKKETTEEYFYKDITNFSTSSESVSAPSTSGCLGKSKPQAREYNKFTLIVPGDKFPCSISGVPDAEQSISAMKQKLREKKG